jgi:phosphoribosylformylglycinamidine cyclo-ligase
MPDMYGPGEYDLAGFCVAAVERSELRDGGRVREGDVLLALPSSGPHSNGYSLIRRVLARAGFDATQGDFDVKVGGVPVLDALMAPTQLYVKPILALLQAFPGADSPIHGMAHITGGGLTENIIRVIPEGLGLDIDARAIVLPPVFDWLQREGAIADAEMWRTFNCGIGFVLVVPESDITALSGPLAAAGLAPRPIGRVVRKAGSAAHDRVRIG